MKILKITFRNINNLRGGPHVVAFNEAPLDTAGIFAILGPTGSGKSTLLDVITLALFNRIPRFKKSISKNEMLGLGSVITQHAKEASAVIIYEIDGKKYTSQWNVSKTKTGTLKDYEMSLQNAEGEYFDLKRSEVPAKNEEIIGLKYDQFVKSIILSQGEFSKFLKADKSERGKLLENITGTSIYRKIGQEAYLKFKKVKAEVELEQHKLGEILIFSEEELVEIKKEIDKKTAEKLKAEKEVQKLTTIKQVKVNLSEIQQQLSTKNKAIGKLQAAQKEFKPRLQKLALHEKINPLRGDLTLFRKTKENKIQTDKNLKQYESALEEAEKGFNVVIKKMSELTGERVNESNFKNVMGVFEREVHKMDAELNHILNNGKDQRNRINEKLENYPVPIDTKIGATEALNQLNSHEKQLLLAINQSSLSADTDIAKSKAKLKSDLKTKDQLTTVYNLLLQKNEIAIKFNSASKALITFEKEKANLEPLLKESQKNLEGLEKISKLLIKQKEDALKIASLEQLRNDLNDKEPCPLCGSLSHPYSQHQPDIESSSISNQIDQNLKLLETQRLALKDLDSKKIKFNTSITFTKKEMADNKKETAAIQQKITTAKKEINVKVDFNEKSLAQSIKRLEQETNTLELAIEALQVLNLNKELNKAFTELSITLKRYQDLKSKRNNKFKGDDPSISCNKLQDQFASLATSKTENKKAQAIETKDLQRAEELLQKITQHLQPKVTALGFNDISHLELQLLDENEVANLKGKNENFIKEEASLKAELKSLKASQTQQIKEDKFPDLPLTEIAAQLLEREKDRDQIIDYLGAQKNRLQEDEERKARRKKKEKEIDALNKKLAKWSDLNHIIGDATGNKFSNFAQGLTLQNLLVFTNKRLRHLTDRYLLNMPGDNGSFRVIDQYQGNTERSVSTLSGGETFLLSLALALSLSDMASKNVALDSLFIDEGFGTLDQETLDIALDTLEALQTESQKTVGVISHVEALKERIAVQIRLKKDAQGGSRLVVVG